MQGETYLYEDTRTLMSCLLQHLFYVFVLLLISTSRTQVSRNCVVVVVAGRAVSVCFCCSEGSRRTLFLSLPDTEAHISRQQPKPDPNT